MLTIIYFYSNYYFYFTITPFLSLIYLRYDMYNRNVVSKVYWIMLLYFFNWHYTSCSPRSKGISDCYQHFLIILIIKKTNSTVQATFLNHNKFVKEFKTMRNVGLTIVTLMIFLSTIVWKLKENQLTLLYVIFALSLLLFCYLFFFVISFLTLVWYIQL